MTSDTLRKLGMMLCLLASCLLAPVAAYGQNTPAAQPTTEAHINVTTKGSVENVDPFEKFNRAMFDFNHALDSVLFEPLARGYRAVLPEPARNCVGNVFGNIGDVWVAFNNLLQGKLGDAVSDLCRVVVNSTVGLAGCFDIASEMGLQKHNEDFGQTLGKWGVGSGAYLVLPIIGSSTVRDGFGLVADIYADPVGHINHVPTRNTLYGTRFVDRRASLLSAGELLGQVALDRYTFVRDSFLQRRRSLIYDGNPPEDKNSTDASMVEPVAKTAPEPGVAVGAPVGWFDAPNQRDQVLTTTSSAL